MGIYTHRCQLPRKGRGIGTLIRFYGEGEAFTVKYSGRGVNALAAVILMSSIFLRGRVSQVHRRLIRRYFHGIGFPRAPSLYHQYTRISRKRMKNL